MPTLISVGIALSSPHPSSSSPPTPSSSSSPPTPSPLAPPPRPRWIRATVRPRLLPQPRRPLLLLAPNSNPVAAPPHRPRWIRATVRPRLLPNPVVLVLLLAPNSNPIAPPPPPPSMDPGHRNRVTGRERIGHGSFGAVFHGELPNSISVAVKRLERPIGGDGDREFRVEVHTIGSVHHVNLVCLRGFCSDDTHCLLVYDYMPLGPLSAYLRRNSQPPLSWAARFRIAVGTARGIAYLHEECRDRIIHCDIKPESVLLDGNFTPRVSDFRLAKLVGRDRSRVITEMRGTRGYVAPERRGKEGGGVGEEGGSGAGG